MDIIWHMLIGANVGATLFLLKVTWVQASLIDDILDLIKIERSLKSLMEEDDDVHD